MHRKVNKVFCLNVIQRHSPLVDGSVEVISGICGKD
jgi:hypothetical protein